MNKSLIFHIGLQKTGTSSIQVMLAGSRDYLRNQGYFYPDLPTPEKPERIWVSPFRHNIIASTYADYLSAFPKFSDEQRKQFWGSLGEETTNPILSAEDFSRQNNFGRFVEDFSAFDVDVVMYVRRQDRFIESLYNQRNKILVSRGDPAFLNESFLTEADLFHFIRQQNYVPVLNFPNTLGRIRKSLSPREIHVRVFDRAQLAGGDVCVDFADVLGLDAEQMFKPASEANGSISNKVLEGLKRVYLENGTEAAREELARINTRLASGEDLSGSYTLLTDRTRREVLRQYQDINAELHREFGVSFS